MVTQTDRTKSLRGATASGQLKSSLVFATNLPDIGFQEFICICHVNTLGQTPDLSHFTQARTYFAAQ